ncbi:MAG: peptide/nickel transport system ATP-binding protein [Porticoccus sp.]|jgi:peptide/nickel transport system ATP-binding protein
MTKPLLNVSNLTKYFPVRGGVFMRQTGAVHAVDNVSLAINPGQTLGLVGESGCGKSTLGKTILQLLGSYQGSIQFEGQELSGLSNKKIRALRRDIQIIFQDPMESLNSRHTVGQIIEEPLKIHNIGDNESRKRDVLALIKRVGLNESSLEKYPHEFSGGQRQRIGIARAIALKPKLVICDEPVSALDVSIQSQILNLLMELQQEMNMALLFISHDLSVVRHISDRVAVMYLGEIVETGKVQDLYSNPKHPYTKALIKAIPQPVAGAQINFIPMQGDVPSAINPPSGCRFHPRCLHATEQCSTTAPAPETIDNHSVSCHHWRKI